MSLYQRISENFTTVTECGCWLWEGAWNRNGYGMLWSNDAKNMVLAHRVSWELSHGCQVPSGKQILHRCDTPACINPDHLFVGSQADNVFDMDTKGRRKFRFGEQHPSAKLTSESVIEIRGSKESNATLAVKYGVSDMTISSARRGVLWRQVK